MIETEVAAMEGRQGRLCEADAVRSWRADSMTLKG